MDLPPPPRALVEPNLTILPSGEALDRLHSSRFDGTDFNPCAGGKTRFAPIKDVKGECVPSLYAGSTLECAIFETVFHDIPARGAMKTIAKWQIEDRTHSQLKTRRDLSLARLYTPDLLLWNISRNQLISSPASQYEKTALWAEAVHHQFANVDGLAWTSNRCDPDTSYLFFGDRVSSSDLETVATRDARTDKNLQAEIRQSARRGGITITL